MTDAPFLVRPATPADAEAAAAIYAPYVAETAVSFESAPPDAAEMARRIKATLASGFPWVVAERSGVVVGYAYAGPFRKREAYAPSAELSVYVAESAHGRGIGRALVEAVEDACRARGNANLLACVAAAPEPGDPFLTDASLRFHERLGFAPCARFHACASKFGRWYDIVYLEKRLDGHPFPTTPIFRPMRRFKQQLPDEEALAVLRAAKRGVLSVAGDGGRPYGIPLNPFWDDETGRLYFHGAREGHKIDALRRDPRACFTVLDEGVHDASRPPDWALTFRSVTVFGRVEFVENQAEAIEICRRLARRFYPDEAAIEEEIRLAGSRVLVFALVPEHITGKRVHEA